MQGAYLGPEYSPEEIETYLRSIGATYERLERETVIERIAELLAAEKIIGFFNGRMEFGPRALGARSIIGDPRSPRMQAQMNLKIKFRESFRPFAPSVLRERVADYFEMDCDSPYMLLVGPVKKERQIPMTDEQQQLWGIDQLNVVRSDIPAITHIDYSARVQTVSRDTNPNYYDVIKAFEQRTGCAVIVNTSFNVRGEPIVCTPEDAYRCFMRTHIDYLVLWPFMLDKTAQPEWKETKRLAQRIPARLSPAEGRKFALTVGAAFVALAGFTWWRGHQKVATVAGALGAAFIVAGLLAPGQLGLVYRGWMAFGLALSKITTPIFMGVVYFLVISPIGTPPAHVWT